MFTPFLKDYNDNWSPWMIRMFSEATERAEEPLGDDWEVFFVLARWDEEEVGDV